MHQLGTEVRKAHHRPGNANMRPPERGAESHAQRLAGLRIASSSHAKDFATEVSVLYCANSGRWLGCVLHVYLCSVARNKIGENGALNFKWPHRSFQFPRVSSGAFSAQTHISQPSMMRGSGSSRLL